MTPEHYLCRQVEYQTALEDHRRLGLPTKCWSNAIAFHWFQEHYQHAIMQALNGAKPEPDQLLYTSSITTPDRIFTHLDLMDATGNELRHLFPFRVILPWTLGEFNGTPEAITARTTHLRTSTNMALLQEYHRPSGGWSDRVAYTDNYYEAMTAALKGTRLSPGQQVCTSGGTVITVEELNDTDQEELRQLFPISIHLPSEEKDDRYMDLCVIKLGTSSR